MLQPVEQATPESSALFTPDRVATADASAAPSRSGLKSVHSCQPEVFSHAFAAMSTRSEAGASPCERRFGQVSSHAPNPSYPCRLEPRGRGASGCWIVHVRCRGAFSALLLERDVQRATRLSVFLPALLAGARHGAICS